MIFFIDGFDLQAVAKFLIYKTRKISILRTLTPL